MDTKRHCFKNSPFWVGLVFTRIVLARLPAFCAQSLRAPLKIHFGEQANLFDSGRRQEKTALASTKADFPSLPEHQNLLLAAQKQLIELPLTWESQLLGKSISCSVRVPDSERKTNPVVVYLKKTFPDVESLPVQKGMPDRIGLHWREGGHAQGPEDWTALLDFADQYFFGKKANRAFDTWAYPDADLPFVWKEPGSGL